MDHDKNHNIRKIPIITHKIPHSFLVVIFLRFMIDSVTKVTTVVAEFAEIDEKC